MRSKHKPWVQVARVQVESTNMQVSVESTGSLQRRMTVEVPEQKIAEAVETRLSSLAKSTRIDGFRPGKVPYKVVKQRFGQHVRQEVIGEVMQSSFLEALHENRLRLAGQPEIKPLEKRPGEGLAYTAVFEVYPEVALTVPPSLRIEQPVCEISDADIDTMIEKLRQQNSAWEEVERAAEMGDQLIIDFTGYVEGEKFAGGEAEDFNLELGASFLLEGFEEGLVGTSAADQRELNLTFPEEYRNELWAGKAVLFKVLVKKVLARKLPELNKEFFAHFNVEDIDAFRTEIKANMQREIEERIHNVTKNNVCKALVENNPVELPGVLVAGEAKRLLADARQNVRLRGGSAADAEKLSVEQFNDTARRRVALGLVMAEIVKQKKLQASPARIRQSVEKLAASYQDPAAVIKWYYDDKSRLSEIENAVLEDEVVDWVVAQAGIQSKPVSFDELMNPRQTSPEAPSSKAETADNSS